MTGRLRPLLLVAAAAALPAYLPPALAGTAAVSEKAYEDTSVGYSILPLRGWEPKPKKNPDDPLARCEAGGWYSKDPDWKDAECRVLKFGSYFGEGERGVATEDEGKGKDGGGEGGPGGGDGGGEGGKSGGGDRKPEGPRTLKEMFGKGPESFQAWLDGYEKALRQRNLYLTITPVKAKMGEDEGAFWEGSIQAGHERILLYGASVKRRDFEVGVLYFAPDGKNFVRDLKGALKASLKSLRILPEKTMQKARDALQKKLAGADAEAAWAEKAIAALPPGWKHHKSAHYVVLYDKSIDTTNPGLINRIANQLERIRAQVYEPLFPAARPITALSIVKVTQDPNQYREYGGPDGSAGYWNWVSRELVFFCVPDGTQKGVNLTLDVLNHEGFHQYIFYAVGQFSPHSWFNEGHGDYFAGFDLKEGKFTRGKFAWRQKRIQDAIEGKHHVPLKEFFKFSQAEYYRRGGNKRKGEDVGQNYAQGWSLIWFLRTTSDSKYAGILDRYFNTMKDAVTKWRTDEEEQSKAAGRAPSEIMPPDVNEKIAQESLDAALQGVDIDQLEKDWIASKPY